MQKWVFAALGLMMAVASVRLVTTKNVVRGALYLLVVLAGVAAAFLVLTAEFLAWVQVLIYIGAVVVLLLFGVMLTRAPIGKQDLDNSNRGLAALVAVATFSVTAAVVVRAFEGRQISFAQDFEAPSLGGILFTKFVLPFEVVSVLLLAALVGAVILAKKDT